VQAVHRKIHLFGDGDAQRFSPGTDAPALFGWRGWRLGLLICFDVEHDAPLQSLAERGAHAVLVPTANMVGFDDVQLVRLPDAARRFGLAIAYANACGQEGATVYNGLSTALETDGSRAGLAGRDKNLLTITLRPLNAPPSTPPARTGA
jgi:predicted amidohydrolase